LSAEKPTMNKKIKKYRLIILGVAVVGFIVLVRHGIRERKKLINFLYHEPFHGTIIRFKDLNRMNYEIWLSNSETSHDIPGFGTYKNDIRIGDSLFKKKNSPRIYYYKKNEKGEFYLFDKFEIK